MNPEAFFKFSIKKNIGPFLPRFRRFLPMLKELEKTFPRFLRQKAEGTRDKRLLLVGPDIYSGFIDAIYAKALEEMGYETFVLTSYTPFLSEVFGLFGVNRLYFFDDYFIKYSQRFFLLEARAFVSVNSEEKILKLKKGGVNVGAFAASTFLRVTRQSTFSLNDKNRGLFVKHLTKSLMMEKAARNAIDDLKPDLVMMVDRGYTPTGQVFDICLESGINVITHNGAHKSGHELLKRYKNTAMSSVHPYSLSRESWRLMNDTSWSDGLWRQLYDDLSSVYKSGDWFSEVGTQFHKKIYNKEELFTLLQLDKSKKVALVFPHIFWDGTFFWGKNLFRDYYEWFCEVLRVAARNKNLNWVIKVHPANLVKDKRDNYRGENLELKAIKEILGSAPSHIKIIPPESAINTFSLYAVGDFCLTVRGTPGMEAAIFGIKTITAGTGRYDRLGFTYDFDSKSEYLDCISALPDLPPMTDKMIELARRFAYGSLIMRTIYLDIFEYNYIHDEKATMRFRPLFKTKKEFEDSKFIQSFRSFVASGKEDYLNSEIL